MAIKTAVIRTAAPSATGTQDFTSTGFGTAKACILVCGTAITDGTAASNNMFNFGFASGSANRFSMCTADEDGQVTQDCSRGLRNDNIVWMPAPGTATSIAVADFSGFVTDGVRLNWSQVTGDRELVTVILLGGDDLSAHASAISWGDTVNEAIGVSGVGFEPDVVFMLGSRDQPFNTPAGGDVEQSYGVAHNDGAGGITQRAIGKRYDNGVATAANELEFYDTAALTYSNNGVHDWRVVLSAFDSGGFVATATDAGGNLSDCAFLALKFANHQSWVGTHTSPSATGSVADTGPGFTPQLAILGPTLAETAGSTYTDTHALSLGLAAFDGTNEFCTTVSSEDGVGTTNTQSLSDNTAIELPDSSGSSLLTAAFTSFDANGFTLNYTATSSSPRLMWGFAVEASTATASRTHVLDAVLQAVGETRTHVLQSTLKATATTTHILAAGLKGTATRTHPLDATLKAVSVSRAHSLDATLKAEAQTAAHVVGAILKTTATATHSLQATLKATATDTHQLGAILKGTATRTHSLQAILQTTATRTHVLQATLKATASRTHALAATLSGPGTKTHSLAADLRGTATRTHILQATLQATATATYSLDAILKATATDSHVLAAILKGVGTARVHTFDAILKAQGNTKTHVLQATLQAASTGTKAYKLDSILQATATKTHVLGGILQTTATDTHALQTTLKATTTRTYSQAANLKAQSTGRVHSLDSILKAEAQTTTHALDSILQATGTKTHSLGAGLQATTTGTYALQAILQATGTDTHVLQAILQATATTSHILQASLVVASTKTHSLQATLQATSTAAHILQATLSTAAAPAVVIHKVLKGEIVTTVALLGAVVTHKALKGEIAATVAFLGEV